MRRENEMLIHSNLKEKYNIYKRNIDVHLSQFQTEPQPELTGQLLVVEFSLPFNI